VRRGEKTSPASCPTLTHPKIAQSLRDRAIAGRLARVFFGREPASFWETHCDPEVEAALFLGDAEGEAGWTDRAGREVTEEFKGPHVWVVPPGVPHWIRLRTATEVVAIYGEPEFFDEVSGGTSLVPELFPLAPCLAEDGRIAELIAAFEEFRRRSNSPGRNEVDGTGRLLALRVLAAHLAPRRRERDTDSGLSEATLKHLLEYIRHHIGEKLTRAVLAREARTSRWHFARLFKMSTGKSPGRYIRELRLDLARTRLLSGSCSVTVTEVAHELGFCDHNQLAYNFKKRFGVTPGGLQAAERKARRTKTSVARTHTAEEFAQNR